VSAAFTRRVVVRWATLGVVAVMLATACGPKTEIRYVDPPGTHGSYRPFIQTTDPRVDRNGHHTVPPFVAIRVTLRSGDGKPYLLRMGTHILKAGLKGAPSTASFAKSTTRPAPPPSIDRVPR
jgi:hypothetical protein